MDQSSEPPKPSASELNPDTTNRFTQKFYEAQIEEKGEPTELHIEMIRKMQEILDRAQELALKVHPKLRPAHRSRASNYWYGFPLDKSKEDSLIAPDGRRIAMSVTEGVVGFGGSPDEPEEQKDWFFDNLVFLDPSKPHHISGVVNFNIYKGIHPEIYTKDFDPDKDGKKNDFVAITWVGSYPVVETSPGPDVKQLRADPLDEARSNLDYFLQHADELRPTS